MRRCGLNKKNKTNNKSYLSKMPFLELSLHITDQHPDPGSSGLEKPERSSRRDFRNKSPTFALDGNIWLVLTLPKEPWPRTLSSSNWDGSAFSQPSFTWWVIGISLYVPSSYTNSISMRQAGMSSYMCAHMLIRLQAHPLYLHSARKTLPPPWARPWSDAHWPAAKATILIRGSQEQ